MRHVSQMAVLANTHAPCFAQSGRTAYCICHAFPRRPQACTLLSAKLQEDALQQAGLICDRARATARVRGNARSGQSPASECHGLKKSRHLVMQRILHATSGWRTCRRADGQTGACCTLVKIRVSVGWLAAGRSNNKTHSRKIDRQQECKNRLSAQEHTEMSRWRLQSMDGCPQTIQAATCRAKQAQHITEPGLARKSTLQGWMQTTRV